jgi:hypothetical protein
LLDKQICKDEREREREREEMHLKYLHKLTSILDELFELKSYSLTSTVGEMMETPVDTSDKQVQCRRAPKLWHSENTSSVIK